MKPSERQKMCLQCEARIPFTSISCPYCGSLQDSKTPIQTDFLSPLYPPLYNQKEEKESAFKTVQVNSSEEKLTADLQKEPISQKSSKEIKQHSTTKDYIKTTLAVCLGADLLLLAILQFLFAQEGMITLQWEGRYWAIYLVFSLPFLIYGYQKIKKIDV
ncbi:MAG: hypothetical protein ACOVOR_04455 [Rhabdochlamydiaceae bacterium]